MNPVNAHVGPFIEKAFKDAVDRGLVAVCYGGADVGKYLVEHPGHRRDPHHRLGQDARHDGVGPSGSRARGAQGQEGAALEEGDHLRARQHLAGDRGAGAVQRRGAGVSGREHHGGDRQQRLVQLQLGQAAGHAEGLGQGRQAQEVCRRRRARQGAGAQGLLSGRRPSAGTSSSSRTRRSSASATPSRARCRGRSSRTSTPAATDKVFSMEPWCSVLSARRRSGSADPIAFLDEAVKF